MDDSRKSVAAGARGEFTMISAQRPAPHLTRRPCNESRPRFPALARTALGCVLALAVLATPALAQAPAAVSDVAVVPVPRSSNSLTVSWSAPDNAGKPAITGYDVRYRVGDTFNWTTVRQDAPNTSVIIAGLRSNAYYDFQVRALNTDGSGPWSSTAEGATSPRPERGLCQPPADPRRPRSRRLLPPSVRHCRYEGRHQHEQPVYSNFILDPALHIVEPGNLMNRGGWLP